MKTNAFFQLFVVVACMMCVGCTGKRKAQSDITLVKETPPAVQSPEVTDDTLAVEEPDTETSTDTPPQPVAMVLEPVVREFLPAVLFLRIRFICIQNMIIIL